MKKIFMLFLLFLISSGFASAQSPTDKGVYSISGGVSFTSTSTEGKDDNFNVFSISPGLYFFAIPNLAIGGTFAYMNMSQGDFGYSLIGIGPGAKYYFDAGDMKLFTSASFLYSSGKSKDADDAHKTTDITIGGGLDFFLSKNVSLEPFIRYHIIGYKYGDSDGPDQKQFEIGVGIGIFVF